MSEVSEHVTSALVGLSNVLLGEETLEALLGRIAQLTAELIENGTGVGVTILDNGRPVTAASTAGFVRDIDDVQYEPGGGPCVEAAATGIQLAVPNIVSENRWPGFASTALEHGIVSSLSLPMTVGQIKVGALNIYSSVANGLVGESTEAVAKTLADHAAVMVANAQAFHHERRTALLLQRTLLPARLPQVGGYELAVRYQPADTTAAVGGDWYDAIWLPDQDTLCLVIGDVMGHGMEPAAVMGRLRTGAEAYAAEGAAPADVLSRLDNLLNVIDDGAGDRLATMCFVCLQPRTGQLRMAGAGHLPPAIAGEDGSVCLLDGTTGPPLGVGFKSEWTEAAATLAPGSVLVMYTDGLIEGRHRNLCEGLVALRTALSGCPRSAEATCQSLIDQLVGDQPQEDDVALLVLRRLPG